MRRALVILAVLSIYVALALVAGFGVVAGPVALIAALGTTTVLTIVEGVTHHVR